MLYIQSLQSIFVVSLSYINQWLLYNAFPTFTLLILSSSYLTWYYLDDILQKFTNGTIRFTKAKITIWILSNAIDFAPDKFIQTLLDYTRRDGDYITMYLLMKRYYLISDPVLTRAAFPMHPKYLRRSRVLDYLLRFMVLLVGY